MLVSALLTSEFYGTDYVPQKSPVRYLYLRSLLSRERRRLGTRCSWPVAISLAHVASFYRSIAGTDTAVFPLFTRMVLVNLAELNAVLSAWEREQPSSPLPILAYIDTIPVACHRKATSRSITMSRATGAPTCENAYRGHVLTSCAMTPANAFLKNSDEN